MNQLLEQALNQGSSDLHLVVGAAPTLRVQGELRPILNQEVLTPDRAQALVLSLLDEAQRELLLTNKELDFSFDFQGQARFRVNAYFQKGTLAAALRLLPIEIPPIQTLNLPEICHSFTRLKQGFVLVTGPTGQGKSTTIASILEEINQTRPTRIVTVEDPIEYVLNHKKAVISQREIRHDTHSWQIALRSCLREDPDVVMVGEMRDHETISSALTIAETGHLVFSTLHTNSAAQTVDRIVDVFPEHQQSQVRMQLASTLEAVVSQRLLPSVSGKRVPAVEILVATAAVKTAIREGKTHLIDNVIQTSAEAGMRTLEMDLARLVQEGKISLEVAQAHALRPEELMRLTSRRGR